MAKYPFAESWLKSIHVTWPDYEMSEQEMKEFDDRAINRGLPMEDTRSDEKKEWADDKHIAYFDALGYGP